MPNMIKEEKWAWILGNGATISYIFFGKNFNLQKINSWMLIKKTKKIRI